MKRPHHWSLWWINITLQHHQRVNFQLSEAVASDPSIRFDHDLEVGKFGNQWNNSRRRWDTLTGNQTGYIMDTCLKTIPCRFIHDVLSPLSPCRIQTYAATAEIQKAHVLIHWATIARWKIYEHQYSLIMRPQMLKNQVQCDIWHHWSLGRGAGAGARHACFSLWQSAQRSDRPFFFLLLDSDTSFILVAFWGH